MTENIFATGGCLCGDVKFTVTSAPVMMGQCHCDDCRKSSGTGHATNAFFVAADVSIEGKTSSYDSKTDSGAVITRYFCPTCGSRLFGKHSERSNTMMITAGTMDNNDWFKPNFIVYNKSRPAWDIIDESLPIFEAMPPVQK